MAPYAAAARTRYYHDTASATIASEASPHRLVAMLYEGVLERLAQARSAIGNHDIPAKLKAVNGALAIIEHLRVVLDHRAGGTLAERLDQLYDFSLRHITLANARNDAHALAEVSRIMITLKAGWDGIGPEAGPRASN